MMGCDGACAAGFDLVFIGLPLLSLYEIPMLIWFIWRAFHWKRDDKDWLKGTAILATVSYTHLTLPTTPYV